MTSATRVAETIRAEGAHTVATTQRRDRGGTSRLGSALVGEAHDPELRNWRDSGSGGEGFSGFRGESENRTVVPTYFWVGAGFQSEAMSSRLVRPTPMSVAIRVRSSRRSRAGADHMPGTNQASDRWRCDTRNHARRIADLSRLSKRGASQIASQECLKSLGIAVTIIDRVGTYPSPTVLIDDVDVMQPDSTRRVAMHVALTCRRVIECTAP